MLNTFCMEFEGFELDDIYRETEREREREKER